MSRSSNGNMGDFLPRFHDAEEEDSDSDASALHFHADGSDSAPNQEEDKPSPLALQTFSLIKTLCKTASLSDFYANGKLLPDTLIQQLEKGLSQETTDTRYAKTTLQNEYKIPIDRSGILRIKDTETGRYDIYAIYKPITPLDEKKMEGAAPSSPYFALGKGATSTALLIQNLRTGAFEALKVFHTALTSFEDIQKEAETLALLKKGSAVVVDKKGGKKAGEEFYIRAKLYFGSSLSTLLQTHALTPIERFDIMLQLLNELQLMHKSHLIHRDLSPNNIIVDPETETTGIIDFGATIHAKKDTREMLDPLMIGVTYFMPLEVTNYFERPKNLRPKEPVYSTKSDIFSLGMIMLSVFGFKELFDFSTLFSYKLADPKNPSKELSAEGFPYRHINQQADTEFTPTEKKEIITLIKSMLTADPQDRPTATSAYKKLHAIFQTKFTHEQRDALNTKHFKAHTKGLLVIPFLSFITTFNDACLMFQAKANAYYNERAKRKKTNVERSSSIENMQAALEEIRGSNLNDEEKLHRFTTLLTEEIKTVNAHHRKGFLGAIKPTKSLLAEYYQGILDKCPKPSASLRLSQNR